MASMSGPVQADIAVQDEGKVFAPMIVGNVFYGPCNIHSDSTTHQVITEAAATSTPGQDAPLHQTSASGDDYHDYSDASTNLKDSLKVEYERILDGNSLTGHRRLDCCHLTEVSCGLLASVLSSNSSYLIELDLSNNDLQDSGVGQLSEGLRSSQCKLKTLKLSGCMITEEGCSSLASALDSNPSHLRELDLSYNHPGESGVRQLNERQNDPNFKLEILNTDHGGEERVKPGLRKYACELTLDADTAHTDLSVSDENRTVKWLKEKPPSPDHPDRFDSWSQVLSRESLSGRCYWEVEWSDMGVHIGVTYKGISRKGKGNECWFGQNDKSWSLDCTKEKYTARHSSNKTIISATGRCSYKIGVYLDWPAGRLSFYNVSSDTQKQKLSHLHTFFATFTEPLYTGFMVIDSTVTLCKLV
ncbi:uncharacterized protein LOC108413143 isoform X2 [Pygocentrus nattereri]|uniref:uncharacterized protein LOC108413143 isoform X2 n=1 Tax=Pygocentrus nattereri TaxID=42514 RepID=UPI001890C1E9|nr:uncharacterized protein LOC108413143 isoform X2 [Pygocentrus nattereri]